MTVDEKTIKRLVQQVLSEMNRQDCNVPIVKDNQTLYELDGVSGIVPTWDVVFSCDNPVDRNDRHKAKFSIETPPEKSESEIKAEISQILERQLGRS